MTENQTLAKDVLGYLPKGYVCCIQTCSYVKRPIGLRLIGKIYADGKQLASVLLDAKTLRVTNMAGA